MLNIELDEQSAIAIFRPDAALLKSDFEHAASIIDPYIEKHGGLNGLIICTKSFLGWESLAALIKHFVFVKDHHKFIMRVALVTDSSLGDFAEKIAGHFVAAEIKHFPFDAFEEAKHWIQFK